MKSFVLVFMLFSLSHAKAEKKPVLIFDETGREVHQVTRAEDPAKNLNSEYDGGAKMGLPVYSGNACPPDSLSSTLSPDNRTLSVIFDSFISEALTVSSDRKQCRLRIPVKVSPGFQVTIVKTDLRGFTALPQQARSTIRMTHNFIVNSDRAEKRWNGKPFVRVAVFEGPVEDDIFIGQHIESEPLWSPCGESLHVDVSTLVTVTNGPSPDTALTIIDSLDIQSDKKSMKYHLNWRGCKPGPGIRPVVEPIAKPSICTTCDS